MKLWFHALHPTAQNAVISAIVAILIGGGVALLGLGVLNPIVNGTFNAYISIPIGAGVVLLVGAVYIASKTRKETNDDSR